MKHWFCTRTIRPGIRHKTNSIGSGHATTSPDYLQDVAEVADAGAVLITGPANAKTELVEYIHLHDPRLTKVIAGVETVAIRPTRNSSLRKKYLMATDRMLP
jgi:hypothetical protein